MYDDTDPRAKLSGGKVAPGANADGIAAPETIVFVADLPPSESTENARTWFARGQNFVIAYTAAVGPVSLSWRDEYEYVVIAPVDDSVVDVESAERTARLTGKGLVTVPPGESTVTLTEGDTIVRMFPADSPAAARAVNAESYAEAHPRVREVAATAGLTAGLQVHAVADHPPEAGRFGAIFRTETLMVNFLDEQDGPRDPEKLSPHHHDDFEQGSLTIRGRWQHHIRTPWTTKQSQWRDDVHTVVSGPSLTIIPPPTIHTSRGLSEEKNIMIDLFSPPREDFEEQGWVLNAREVRS